MKQLFPVLMLTAVCALGLFADEAGNVAPPQPESAPPVAPAPRRVLVLKPQVSSSLDASLQEVLWHALEDSVAQFAAKGSRDGQPGFVLVNRNALNNTLTEAEFQGTHLVAVGGEKIVPGEFQGASLLLNTAVSKFDESTLFLSMSLLNGTTLEVIPGYQFQDTYGSIGSLLEKLPYSATVLLGQRQIKDMALWYPSGLDVSASPEGNLQAGDAFLSSMRFGLVKSFNVSALEEVRGALKQMHLTSTADLTERDWMRFGTLLGARYLVVPTFTVSKVAAKLISYEGESYPFAQLEFACSLKVVEVQQGRVAAEIQLSPVHRETQGEFGMSVVEYEARIVPAEVAKALDEMAAEATAKLLEAWKEFSTNK